MFTWAYWKIQKEEWCFFGRFILVFLGSSMVIDSVRIHHSQVQCARVCLCWKMSTGSVRLLPILVWAKHARYQEHRNSQRRHVSRRMRSTGTVDDRYLILFAHPTPFMPSYVLINEFRQAIRIRLSDQTVRNRLHDVQLLAMRPFVVPQITNPHRRARLTCAPEILRWNVNQ